MTIAVEPMIAMGDYSVSQLDDGWTIVTDDGSICSHYEHTMAINEKGLPELLTFPGYVLTEEAE
jgi:methionyl aminopeptidase